MTAGGQTPELKIDLTSRFPSGELTVCAGSGTGEFLLVLADNGSGYLTETFRQPTSTLRVRYEWIKSDA